jgi:homoserine kinase
LVQLQEKPARGSAGVTLSGSGPTIIVWARHEEVEPCAQELHKRFDECEVLAVELATSGVQSF